MLPAKKGAEKKTFCVKRSEFGEKTSILKSVPLVCLVDLIDFIKKDQKDRK